MGALGETRLADGGRARLQYGRDGSGVQVLGRGKLVRHLPVDVERVRRRTRLVEDGLRGGRTFGTVAAGHQLDVVRGEVRADRGAAVVVPDERGQLCRVPEPGQPYGDVKRRPTDMLGDLAVHRAHDVHKRLTDHQRPHDQDSAQR